MKIQQNLINHFLIATPTLQDTLFSKSVIYLYEHSAKGAVGLIINKSMQITLEHLLEHLDIEMTDKHSAKCSVLTGGPIEPEQGFIIHDPIEQREDQKQQAPFIISSSKEMLYDISNGKGPDHFLITLGYSRWEQGQLETEISRNDWLVAPVKENILFSTPIEQRWQEAAKSIGIDIHCLSRHTGHA